MALKSSEARAQKRNKTKSVIIFMSRGHTGVIISFKGPPTILGGKAILKRYVSRFLRREARLSQDFNVVGSSFQRMGAATEKARLPRFSLIMGIESCFEVDVLSCLGMLEKCRRLAR